MLDIVKFILCVRYFCIPKNILELFSGDNNELFLSNFKKGLIEVIESQKTLLRGSFSKQLPDDFIINHIASTFVETVRWWIKGKMRLSPEEINVYFSLLIKGE